MVAAGCGFQEVKSASIRAGGGNQEFLGLENKQMWPFRHGVHHQCLSPVEVLFVGRSWPHVGCEKMGGASVSKWLRLRSEVRKLEALMAEKEVEHKALMS